MAKKFYIKETDTQIVLGVNANLTGSTVRVQVRPAGASDPLPDLTSTISNATKGQITVVTEDLGVGVYELEIEQMQAGIRSHYPNKGFDYLIVGEDLDQ